MLHSRKNIKRISAIFIIVIILAGSYFFYFSESSKPESVVVTRVVDGDTVVVEGGERVRLLGIDTQEKGEPCYEVSKERLEEMVLKKEVSIERNGKGQYGRTLGFLFLNGTLVNEQLVREGLAVAYFYEEASEYIDSIKAAEQKAMENNRGCEWS